MRQKKGFILVGLIVSIFGILLAGCGATSQQVSPTAVPAVGTVDDMVSASARVVPLRWTSLGFPGGGKEVEILVQAGDVVSAGQVIARVNQDDLKLALQQAEINRKRAELALKQLEALPADEAVAAARAALANADLNLRELEREGARQIKIDAAQSQVFSAMTNLTAVEAGATDLQIESAQLELDAVNLAIEQAQASLDASEIFMPYDGQVIEVYLQNGEYAAPAQAVLLVADLSQMQIETTDMSEVDAARVKPGDTAVITIDALPDMAFPGKVVRIADRASAGSAVYFTVTLSLDEIPAEARWGMTAFVEMKAGD